MAQDPIIARAKARAKARALVTSKRKPTGAERQAAVEKRVKEGRRAIKRPANFEPFGLEGFGQGAATAFLPPELEQTGGPLLRAADLPAPIRPIAEAQATIGSAIPVFGRASRRILEPSPLVREGVGGEAEQIARSLVNELPNLARSFGEQVGGQELLARAGVPRPVGAALTGAAQSLADTGVPMGVDPEEDAQRALQAAYGGFSAGMGAKLGGVADEFAEGASRKLLARIAPQLPFDILSPLGDLETAGIDSAALLDPEHPQRREAIKGALLGTVPSLAAYATSGPLGAEAREGAEVARINREAKAQAAAQRALMAREIEAERNAPAVIPRRAPMPGGEVPNILSRLRPPTGDVPEIVGPRVPSGAFPADLLEIAHRAGLENEPLVTSPNIRAMGTIEDPGRVELPPEVQDLRSEIEARRRGADLMRREEGLLALEGEPDILPDVRLPDDFALPKRPKMTALPKAPRPGEPIDWNTVIEEQKAAAIRERAKKFIAQRKAKPSATQEVVQQEGVQGERPGGGPGGEAGEAGGGNRPLGEAPGGAPGRQAPGVGADTYLRGFSGKYRILDTLSDGRMIVESLDDPKLPPVTVRPELATNKPQPKAKGVVRRDVYSVEEGEPVASVIDQKQMDKKFGDPTEVDREIIPDYDDPAIYPNDYERPMAEALRHVRPLLPEQSQFVLDVVIDHISASGVPHSVEYAYRPYGWDGELNDVPVAGGYNQSPQRGRVAVISMYEARRKGANRAARVLLHEAIHASVFDAIEDPANAHVVSELDQMRKMAASKGEKHYGLKNVHEFVAEALSNPKFQKFLSGIKYAGSARANNLFSRFVELVWSAIGGKASEYTVLERTIEHAASLMESQRAKPDVAKRSESVRGSKPSSVASSSVTRREMAAIDDAVRRRDLVVIQEMVDPREVSNAASRAYFTSITGVNLPRTLKGTIAAVREWASTGNSGTTPGFGGGAPRRNKRSGFVSLGSRRSGPSWPTRAVQAFDNVIETAKRALVESPSGAVRGAAVLMPNRGAGPAYASLRARLDGRKAVSAAVRVAFEDRLDGVLKRANDVQRAEMERMINDPSYAPRSMTAEQLRVVGEAREMLGAIQRRVVDIDAQSRAAGRPGLFSPNMAQQVMDTFGTYFRRFYRTHEDPDVPLRLRKRNPALWDAAVKEWLATDRTVTTPEQASLKLQSYITQHQVELGERRKVQKPGAGTTELVSPTMKRRLEERPALRQLLGEYTGLDERFSKTFADLSEIENRSILFSDLANPATLDETGRPFTISEEEYLSGKFPEYSMKVPVTEGGAIRLYGDAEGRYMRPHHFESLNDHVGSHELGGAISELIGDTNKVFSIVNTALNPATTGANFVSGAVYHSTLSDSSPLNPANATYYADAAKLMQDRTDPRMKELLEAGVAAGMYLDEPLSSDTFLSYSEAMKQGYSPFEVLKRALKDFDKAPGVKQSVRLYNSIDLWFRLASTLKRLDRNTKRGMPYDAALRDAVAWTNKFHPDYSKVPHFLKKFQKSPIAGPFLSYMFDSPRILFNGLRYNPVKFAALLGGVFAAEAAADIGSTEKEIEAKDAVRALMTDFEQADFTPMVEIDGRLVYLPIGRLMPMAQLIAQLRNPKLGQFFMSSPAMNALSVAVGGNDVRGIRRITRDMSQLERAGVGLRMLAEAHLPPLTPMVGYEAKRIQDAISGKPDRYGRTQSPGFALMGLTGIRPRHFDLDAAFRFRAIEYANGVQDRLRRYNGILDSPRASTANIEEVLADVSERFPEWEARTAELEGAFEKGVSAFPKSVTAQYAKNRKAGKYALNQMMKEAKDVRMKAIQKLPPNHPLVIEAGENR